MTTNATNHSALQGVIEKLHRGERLSVDAIIEIDRVLGLLQGEGWSGFLPADRALKAIIRGPADLTAFTRMLERAGVVFERQVKLDGYGKLETTTVTITEGDGEKNLGYSGFASTFEFDRDGKLANAGAWE